jgi:sugar phosphate isomerase/epimerase
MWTLTGFADEISPDFDVQLRTLRDEGIAWLELRSVWGANVLQLSEAELDTLKQRLEQEKIRVSSIGSPIGKVLITDPFQPHLEQFERAIDVAQRLVVPYIRVFSFYMPEGDEPAAYRNEVIARMTTLAQRAEAANLTLLHENEKHIFGDVPARCLDILETVNSPALRAAWDPANFVQCRVRPYTDGYELLRPYIAYVHVKDALLETGTVVPAGDGDGEWPSTLDALHASGFDGYFSLEPHLVVAGASSGFTGPDLWHKAANRFKHLLRERNIRWA